MSYTDRFSTIPAPTPRNIVVSLYDGGVADNSAILQDAVDGALDGDTITVERPGYYYFRNFVCNKALNFDFNNSRLIVEPTDDGVTTGKPAMWFKGSQETTYPIISMITRSNVVTLATAGNNVNFAVGDYVRVEDDAPVLPWDGGFNGGSSSGSTYGYAKGSEICRVMAIVAGAMILDKPLEWLYSATYAARISRVNMLSQPSVRNISDMVEVDPGGLHTGPDIQDAPHLIKFDYCNKPFVENVHARNFNLHVVNFDHCVAPYMRAVRAEDAYRPTDGGHGYLQRFNRCTDGIVEHCIGRNIRHLADFCQAYGCISRENIAYSCPVAPFAWHGLGAHRCKSIDDTVYTATNSPQGTGWSVGNSSFAGDDDSQIIRPRFFGGASAIRIGYKSQRTEVINPKIDCSISSGAGAPVGILVNTGAVDTSIYDGRIDMSGTTSTFSFPIRVRGEHGIGDSYFLNPVNVKINGTEIKGNPANTNGVSVARMDGDLSVEGMTILGGNVNADAISVVAPAQLNSATIRRNKIGGTWFRGITVLGSAVPTGPYMVTENIQFGTLASVLINIAKTDKLADQFNTSDGTTLNLNGSAAQNRSILFNTTGLLRAIFRLNTADNLEINMRADDGSSVGSPFQVVRTTGQIILGLIGQSMRWNTPTATTVGAAGGVAALPATPSGYITVNINATDRKIPFYNV